MNKKEIQKIIPQIRGESDVSYKRLILYITSNCKDLHEFEDYLKEEHPKLSVTYNTLTTNSSKDNWTERRKKYQEIKEQELEEEVADLFRQLNTRGIHDMDSFIRELGELREDAMQQWRDGVIKASTVLRIMKDYITCYRQATEIYYINSRHKLEPETEVDHTNRERSAEAEQFIDTMNKVYEGDT